MYDLIWPFTPWHWLAIALLLFAIEMALGTFDLLLVGIAALITSAWAAFAPPAFSGWSMELTVFAITSVGLIVLGRTVLNHIRTDGPGEPKLNKRMDRMIGARGVVVSTFSGGAGRVRIGDTEWSAESIGATDLAEGTQIVVDGSRSTVVLVKPSDR